MSNVREVFVIIAEYKCFRAIILLPFTILHFEQQRISCHSNVWDAFTLININNAFSVCLCHPVSKENFCDWKEFYVIICLVFA